MFRRKLIHEGSVMRPFREYLGINTGTGQALTLIVSLILCLSSFARDSQAYTGFCEGGDGSSICCSEDADCGQGGMCARKSGRCWTTGEYCDTAFECENQSQPNACLPVGECMGGEDDGSACSVIKGFCVLPYFPCNNHLDCWPFSTCYFLPEPVDYCPGGACVLCKEGCSIATLTFGTDLESKTDVLRAFRDKYLVSNPLGKAFISAYYKHSPPIADYIAEHGWLTRLVRVLLLSLIGIVSLFV